MPSISKIFEVLHLNHDHNSVSYFEIALPLTRVHRICPWSVRQWYCLNSDFIKRLAALHGVHDYLLLAQPISFLQAV